MRKIKEHLSDIYFDHPYGALAVNRTKTNKYIIDFLKGISNKGNKKIFDIGCGVGELSRLFYKTGFPKKNIVCFDLSASALDHVRRNGFIAVRGDIKDIGFKNGVSDITMSIGVIHHVSSSKNAFAEICRITKSRGFIFISVYNIWHPYFFFIYKLMAPLRYIYRNYTKSIIFPVAIILYPVVQAGSYITTGQFVKKFKAVKTLVADQVFTSRCELFSAAKLRGYGKSRKLTLLKEGLTLLALTRYAIFRKGF